MKALRWGQAIFLEIANETDGGALIVDVPRLVISLLLFDRVVVRSNRLREFDTLVRIFGARGVQTLLASGALRVYCHVVTMGQTGQSDLGQTQLPLNSFRFASIQIADRRRYLHGCMKNIEEIAAAHYRDLIRLKREIASALIDIPTDISEELQAHFIANLRGSRELVEMGVEMATARFVVGERRVPPIELRLDQIGDREFTVAESNLSRLGFDRNTEHRIIERGLLSLGSIADRVVHMRALNAVTPFLDRDVPLFGRRLQAVIERAAPETLIARALRVLTIPRFPVVSDAEGSIDAEKLLQVRQTAEAREFRAWLSTAEPADEIELRTRSDMLSTQLASSMHGQLGRTLRFIVPNVMGALQPLAGVVLDAADTFLLERLAPKNGPLIFVSRQYPSIFKDRGDEGSAVFSGVEIE